MFKLNETQSNILTAGAQRPDNIAMPLPNGLAGAAPKMAVTRMIHHGWLEEVDANLRRGEPLWRETGDGHGTTLVVTDAGLLAIGIGPVGTQAMAAIRKHSDEAPVPKPPTRRTGTKQALLLALLQAPRWCHDDGSDDRSHGLATSQPPRGHAGGLGKEIGSESDLRQRGR